MFLPSFFHNLSVASTCLFSNFAIRTFCFKMTESSSFWPETDAMSEELYSATPRVIKDDEPQTVLQSDPAWSAWDEGLFPMFENDHARSDERLSSNDDMSGLFRSEHVRSEALKFSTADELDHRFWDGETPFLWSHSRLPLGSPPTLERQLSIQAGLSNEMCIFSNDASSTASSVTFQGDDMSQSHADEEEDDDYEDNDFLYGTLCSHGQENLDIISTVCETLPLIEISWEALGLGAYPSNHEPAAVHQLCREIDGLIDYVEVLDRGLGTLNKLAAKLGVTVDVVNDRARDMKKEIQDMGLYVWRARLEVYKRVLPMEYREDHTPVPPPSPQWSLQRESEVYKSDIGSMDSLPSYARTETPSYQTRAGRASPNDQSLFGAASLDNPPPQHAGWDGPSVDHIYDHSTPQSYPYIFDPNEPYEYPSSLVQGRSQTQNDYLYPDWRTDRATCTPQIQQCSCERCNSNST
jgi:hypothetical protein